jgi:hypothetical protein
VQYACVLCVTLFLHQNQREGAICRVYMCVCTSICGYVCKVTLASQSHENTCFRDFDHVCVPHVCVCVCMCVYVQYSFVPISKWV